MTNQLKIAKLKSLIVEINRCIGLSEGVNAEYYMRGLSNQEDIDLLNSVLSESNPTIGHIPQSETTYNTKIGEVKNG